MINTPLGGFTTSQAERLFKLKVFRLNEHGDVSIISEHVNIIKDDTTKDYWIPIRYYNMQYLLWKHKQDFERAFSELEKNPTAYLPAREGFSSYSKMLDATLFGEYKGERKVDMVQLTKQMFLAE